MSVLQAPHAARSKGVVRAGHQQKELPAVKASHGGAACWDSPVELALGPDVTQSHSAAGGFAGLGLGSGGVGLARCMRLQARVHSQCCSLASDLTITPALPRPPQAVTVELSSGGLMGGSLGSVRVPVREVLQRRKFSQGYPLEGGASSWGQVRLEVEWRPYF